MKRALVGMLVLGLTMSCSAVYAECTCKTVDASGNGWCVDCKKGRCFGVAITNDALYKALQGTKVDMAAIKCDGCKKVAEKGGTCDHCHLTYANGNCYHSFVAAALGAGKATDPATIKCPTCKAAAEGKAEGAYCTTCKAGIVGKCAYATEAAFNAAKKAMKVLASAASSKCPTCGTAMVNNGKCDACKMEYKDGVGEKIKA